MMMRMVTSCHYFTMFGDKKISLVNALTAVLDRISNSSLILRTTQFSLRDPVTSPVMSSGEMLTR